jgi:phosphopentomutase
MKRFMRVFFIVLDACGVGELPDADEYGDAGSATLPNTARAVGGVNLPHMERLGLGKIADIDGVSSGIKSDAAYGRLAEVSAGKDSTSGHWEHFGLILNRPFPLYPEGFPADLIGEFSRRSGYGIIGNEPASGTEIIARLGEEHVNSGKLIVYTSADSVFQIAAHEEIIPPDELHRICRVARELLVGEHGVGRVIARPFEGEAGKFRRTNRRKDFSIDPPGPLVVEKLVKAGIEVMAIGKIYDIMARRGATQIVTASGNMSVMDAIIEAAKKFEAGLIMVNLVDFDMLWGHRNDYRAFAQGLEEFDARLGQLLPLLTDDDLLIITADHGCDPTTPSTDHSREYVPLIAYFPGMSGDINLGIRQSFADTGKTIADNFRIDNPFPGKSFLMEITNGT